MNLLIYRYRSQALDNFLLLYALHIFFYSVLMPINVMCVCVYMLHTTCEHMHTHMQHMNTFFIDDIFALIILFDMFLRNLLHHVSLQID